MTSPEIDKKKKPRKRPGLATLVLIGIALGIGFGLFFGEMMAPLKILGNAFVGLLQMSVLPYVAVSLIAALGRLDYRQARILVARCSVILLVLWALGAVLFLMAPLAFPDWQFSAFFSRSLVESTEEIDFLALYIPSNPFQSMANNVVPAVVLFSVSVGVALIGLPNKDKVIEPLSVLTDALGAVSSFVVRLAPIGVFAIAASATGTMSIDEFGRLQVFILTYAAIAIIAAFWALPALIAALTPLTYRQILGPSRDALVTAFATGSLLVILPILAERANELARLCGVEDEDAENAVNVIMPASLNFPNVGAIIALSFILFAGWSSGTPVSVVDYPTLAISGVFSLFGSVLVAMPFLLDLMRIPTDAFQLYVLISQVMVVRFGTLIGAMHMLALAVLGTCSMYGLIRLNPLRLARYAAITIGGTIILLIGVRLFFVHVVPHDPKAYERFIAMKPITASVPTKVSDATKNTEGGIARPVSLDEVIKRGVLRVGYWGGELPFVFQDEAGALVGHSVDVARALAKDLGVHLEFVKIDTGRFAEHLDAGDCDLILSLAITPDRARRMHFSQSYMQQTLAFVLPDHRRDDFKSWDDLAGHAGLRIATPDVPYYIDIARRRMPKAKFVTIDNVRDYLGSTKSNFDAMLFSAESGSAWTMVDPSYTVAIPKPGFVAIPVAFAVARDNQSTAEYIESWIELKRGDGFFERLYNYWILGEADTSAEPRWSIIRNVLGWVD